MVESMGEMRVEIMVGWKAARMAVLMVEMTDVQMVEMTAVEWAAMTAAMSACLQADLKA